MLRSSLVAGLTVSAVAADSLVHDLVSEGYKTGTTLNGAVSNSGKGIDFSNAMSLSSGQCLNTNGYTTVIVRAWHSSGSYDTAACGSLNNAKSAGIPNRDVYMFPCPTCSASASSQLNTMVTNLKAGCSGSWSTMIWLDIEGSQYWLGSTTQNKTWYENLVNACTSRTDVSCGIYSSASQWQAIFGSTSFCFGSNLPLWYAHYDGVANFNDFSTFGCWTKPWGKQYTADVTVCSIGGADVNYIPSQ